MKDSLTQPDRRAERRDARREANRTEILDAAEQVFGERGPRDGSLREIAARSGFSTAAIYLFFENKRHLLSEVLTRQGEALIVAMRVVVDAQLPPLDALHRIADAAIEFFEDRPDFRRMLRHMTGGAVLTESVLAEFTGQAASGYLGSLDLLAQLVASGQEVGEIRDGDPLAIAHFYSVLVNEFILLASPENTVPAAMSPGQFHELLDGALRREVTPVPARGRARTRGSPR